jgi:hypothetical protein
LREVIYPVLKLRKEKRTSVRVGGGKVDFFIDGMVGTGWAGTRSSAVRLVDCPLQSPIWTVHFPSNREATKLNTP